MKILSKRTCTTCQKEVEGYMDSIQAESNYVCSICLNKEATKHLGNIPIEGIGGLNTRGCSGASNPFTH